MNLRDEPPPLMESDNTHGPSTRVWQALAWGMEILGILFLMGGAVSVSLAIGLMHSPPGAELLSSLILLGWMLMPIISGVLLVWAAARLTSSARGSGTFLVVVAASTFAGLVWAAVTAAILLNPVVRE